MTFTEKSTYADLALFLAEHNLRCTRLQAPRGAPAVAILASSDAGVLGAGPSAQGSAPTIHEALNAAARVLRAHGVIK